ncbi:unnamed protein product [Amaranthus hypochondriacus]
MEFYVTVLKIFYTLILRVEDFLCVIWNQLCSILVDRTFILLLPMPLGITLLYWVTDSLFLWNIDKLQVLQRRTKKLEDRLNNVRMRVEDQEFQTGRRRKEVVDIWLNDTGAKCEEVRMLQNRTTWWNIPKQLDFVFLIKNLIREVDELQNFDEVLSDVREPVELPTTTLVGKAANQSIRSILTWLDNGVTKIGLHGIKGIGKTSVLMHINNQLLQYGLDVYMIQVTAQDSEYQLQEEIMNALGFKIQEKDRIRRAALLARKLQAMNFVLIIDGLKNYLSEDKVGIPLDEKRGKIIVSSRSLDVCRKTGCEKMIPMGSLPFDEAYELFRQTSYLATQPEIDPVIEDLAQKIVKLCKGVPRKIVDTASDLRRVHDSSKWEDYLKHELSNSVPSSDQRSHIILGSNDWRQ